MPEFSEKSKRILATCHPKLIALCNTAIMRVDFTIISGFRTEEEQSKLLMAGKSHLGFPHSKHNRVFEEKPRSEAVDWAPYPIDWEDTNRFILLGGYFLGISRALEIGIRWGGNWSGSFQMEKQKLVDLGHIELIK